ncbi:MAG: hypothetical protein J6V78_02470 [Clostridia bacterium]|nr:hypothetical protein [Oscillospiraceae bacterium]MBO7179183.1 hypothetical protein [Clostridia bacterium]
MIFRRNEKNEDVIKRKSYYGFAKYYPGKMGTKSSYVIGESRVAKKKERIRNILVASGFIILFLLSFFITAVCIEISERPIGF